MWSEEQKAFNSLKIIMAKKTAVKIFGHYVNHRCKQTFNIWNIITRKTPDNVFIKKISEDWI